MVRGVLHRDEMVLESLLKRSRRLSLPMWVRCAAALNLSFADPAVTLPAADKILRNLLRRFPSRDLNSVPVSIFVIDEHVRPRTLNS